MQVIYQQPTLSTSAHSAGDCVGGLLTFDYGKVGQRTTVVKRAEILDDASSPDSAALELHLFSDSSFAGTTNEAFSLTQDEYESGDYFGFISFSSYSATYVGTNAAAVISIQDNIDKLVNLRQGKLYGQLVCTGTPTFAADQLVVLVHLAEYA